MSGRVGLPVHAPGTGDRGALARHEQEEAETEMVMADDKPEKIKVSRTTAKKIRATGSNPPQGEELSGLLAKVIKKLREQ